MLCSSFKNAVADREFDAIEYEGCGVGKDLV